MAGGQLPSLDASIAPVRMPACGPPWGKAMYTIAIANQKGGVAKTTTAVTLAHDLARKGHTVILIDLDAQGNAAPCLGLEPAPGLYQVLLNLCPMEDVLIEARPSLWLLRSDASTAKLKTILAAEPYRETILARALEPVTADYVILDTGPSRDLLHDNAHHAAHGVIVPASVDHLALIGVVQELDSLKAVRAHGHAVEVIAILPTFWDTTTNESDINLRKLADTFGDLVLPAVPRTTRLREAPALGVTIWEYMRQFHPAYQAYQHLTRRVLDGR
jgi:chromosome partitioning protein